MNTTDALVNQLLKRIFTTSVLASVSTTLEEIAQNRSFKNHAGAIAADPGLTAAQKRTQLLYLFKSVDNLILSDFFSDILSAQNFWLFSQDKIDYFDTFVGDFQKSIQNLSIVHLTTAIELSSTELKAIADDLTRSFGRQTILDPEVNPAILGGIQIKIDNLIYDLSLRVKFNQFSRQWLASLDKTNRKVGRLQT